MVEHVDGTVLVRPCGELDVATAPRMEGALRALIGEHWALVLDLSAVSFADCAGLRPVREALRAGSHSLTRVTVCGARPTVQRVLDLTQMHSESPVPVGS